MSRLVVVSNRLPPLRDAAQHTPGGLASAMLAALQRAPRSLWLGWNGRTEPEERDAPRLQRGRIGGVNLLGMALTAAELRDYYHGFCNGGLWPLLHCFQSRVHLELKQEASYRAVQARFASVLRPLLQHDTMIWVQDYHLMLLGRELRRAGWGGRIGFFLHTPFPPYELWQLLPEPRDFLEGLLAYDLIGFHTPSFLGNYVRACRRELGARWDGHHLTGVGRGQRAGVYPIGIDPDVFAPRTATRGVGRRGVLARVVRGRRLILGVDRLDYTKGIPSRVLAFESFVRDRPQWRKRVSFVQIASPTRVDVVEYAEQKAEVERLVGRVNGELSEHDWVPIRYLYRTYARDVLAQFYRESDVGLVTPLRDGMNLVAKEFVAAQPPNDPGVLVLSRTAGAAEELQQAVLVNPFMPADVARGIERALTMSDEERLERHAALLAVVREHTASAWAQRFLSDLECESGNGTERRSKPRLATDAVRNGPRDTIPFRPEVSPRPAATPPSPKRRSRPPSRRSR